MVFGNDARLWEIALLAELERGEKVVAPKHGPERDLVAFLIANRYVNDLNIAWQHRGNLGFAMPGESELERRLHQEHLDALSRALAGEMLTLRLTHLGRVRLAQLRQQVQSGRQREEFGILWDGRHFETASQLALLDVRHDRPLAMAFLDMNGLKVVNDTYGHAAGSTAIQAYFHAVATVIGQRGEAYRKGGDEVILLLHGHDANEAKALVRKVCLLLMRDRLRHEETELPPLSISAGIAVTSDHSVPVADLVDRCDKAMYRAKERTKGAVPRPSSIAVANQEAVEIIGADATA